jgi:hypothetical protein
MIWLGRAFAVVGQMVRVLLSGHDGPWWDSRLPIERLIGECLDQGDSVGLLKGDVPAVSAGSRGIRSPSHGLVAIIGHGRYLSAWA